MSRHEASIRREGRDLQPDEPVEETGDCRYVRLLGDAEVLGIADRVIVMCDGKITGEVMAKETSQNEVLKFATEFEKKQQVS